MFKFDVKCDVHIHLPEHQDDKPPSWSKDILRVLLAMSSTLRGLEKSMSELDDRLDRLEAGQAKIATATAGLLVDYTSNTAELQKLRDELAAGQVMSQAQKDRFDALLGKNDEFGQKLEELDNMTPPPPPVEGNGDGTGTGG